MNCSISFVHYIMMFTLIGLAINHRMIMATPCEEAGYQKNTLKLLHERTFADSFIDDSAMNEIPNVPNRFEGSDVVLTKQGHLMYVVFDNTYKIGAICTPLGRSMNCTDRLLDWPDATVKNKTSDFEGISYNPIDDTYFVVQEALPTSTQKVFQANVFEVRISPTFSVPIRIIESCSVNWSFPTNNKGLEGLEFIYHSGSNETYLFGLCEANKCDPQSGSDNDGRILVLKKKKATSKMLCSWEPVGTVKLPSSVHFNDYSSISIYRRQLESFPTYIAVTSQENSQIWIGIIKEISQPPFFTLSALKKQTVYNLPRTTETGANCQIKYCNIEGVAWRGKNQLILISDKAKSDQDIHCIEKDQSVHYVVLPDHLTD